MRVGLVIDANMAVPGGVQEYVRGLYDYLHASGHEPAIVSAPARRGAEDAARRILAVGRRIDVKGLGGQSAPGSITWASRRTLRAFLAQERFDVLHFMAPMGLLALQILAASETTNVATFLVAKDRFGLWGIVAPIFHALERGRLNSRLHGRIALSPPAQRYGSLWFPGFYTIIPAGINQARFAPAPNAALRYDDGKVNILFVGRLDRRKGVPHLLEAYVALRARRDDVRLILVGDGPESSVARAFVAERALPDVIFAGTVAGAELPAYYRSAHIFCSPAYENESFGVVLLEAMAAGLPIAGYANAGYLTVLTEEAQEALAPPGDLGALTAILERLASDGDWRRQLSAWGLEHVQHYTWEGVGARIVEFYRETASLRFDTR
ncbi:MAG: glycosyltransferase family 4 protein [Anaerolineae bacterium]|nr:glycosyltransferase family 4 protein [Anaerolineae bacterium]